MDLGDVTRTILSTLGYPHQTHGLINAVSDTTTLSVAPSAQINPHCRLRGAIDLGPNVRLSTHTTLNGEITIGRGTNVEPKCELVGDVELGNYCAVARNTIFQEPNHETEQPSLQRRLYEQVIDSDLPYTSHGPITVGSDVWFGARCIVLSGVTIGHGAIVAAGTVVTNDVEPYSIVAGTPAERIGWRFPEPVRDALLELSWWEWDPETIRANKDFFETTLQSIDDVPTDITDRTQSTAPTF